MNKLFSVQYSLFVGFNYSSYHISFNKPVFVSATDEKNVRLIAPEIIRKNIEKEFCSDGDKIKYFSLSDNLHIQKIETVEGKNHVHKIKLIPQKRIKKRW